MFKELSFLRQSNLIEDETSFGALWDAWKAWRYLKKQKVLTTDVILTVHWILMKNIDPWIAGRLRNCDVQVGGKKVDISPTEVPDRLIRWIIIVEDVFFADAFINSVGLAIDMHIAFEKIHPFRDGNGRVGRMLYNWHRLRFGLSIDVIRADERESYYKWFNDR